MLTRKCGEEIDKLMTVGDFNVRISVGKKYRTRFVTKSLVEQEWKELIKKALGKGIYLDSENIYMVSIQINARIIDEATFGSEIINVFWEDIKNVDIFRIDISKSFDLRANNRSWIIARD